MTTKDFIALSGRQRHAVVLAMAVRHALESFHHAHLTQEQMKELNQTTRYALYDAIELIETMSGDAKKEAFYDWLRVSIPDYWEIPGRDPRPGEIDEATM